MKHSFLILLGLPLLTFAQDAPAPGETPSTKPVPELADAGSGSGPVLHILKVKDEVDPEALALKEGDIISEANITVLEVAKIYEKHSGKRAILPVSLAETEVSFTLGGPLTNDELSKFLQLTMLAEGVAIIPVPGEPGIVRFVPSGPIISLGPVTKYYDDADDLPADDEIIMFLMTFDHLKPEKALKIMQSKFGKLTESGSLTAVPNSSTLIVTEKTSLIRRMLEIRADIDKPTAESTN